MAHSIAWAALIVVAGAFLPAASAQEIAFGDDSSEYARDGECDDRRFTGTTMASSLSLTGIGRDATDCRRGHEAGALRLWDPAEARAATDCASISFGDDSSAVALDGQCDDIRFEGVGSAAVLLPEDTFGDATDCRRLCQFGAIFLRDY
jgi:hypothetical protein